MTGLILVAILFGVAGTLYGVLAYRAVRSERRRREEEINAIAETMRITIRRRHEDGDQAGGPRRHLRALSLVAALAVGGEWLRRHQGDYRPLVLTGALVVAAAALIVALNPRPPGIPGRALPPATTGTLSPPSVTTAPIVPRPSAPPAEGTTGPMTPARPAPPPAAHFPQPPGEPTGTPLASTSPTTTPSAPPPTGPAGRPCLIELSVDAVGLDLCVLPPRTPARLLRL